VTGTWNAHPAADSGANAAPFTLQLTLEPSNRVTGTIDSRGGGTPLSGTFTPASGEFKLEFDGALGPTSIEGKIADGKMTGRQIAQSGTFSVSFDGERAAPPARALPAQSERTLPGSF
jgi:hypothetical protein